MVESDPEYYLRRLQQSLQDGSYRTSEYEIFTKTDSGKHREIYKLPYYPDRICQWAIMLQIEKILLKTFVDFSCASIPNKGIYYASSLLRKDTATRLKGRVGEIQTRLENSDDKQLKYKEWCSINSYKGWIKWCNSYNLYQSAIQPLEVYNEKYYKEVILNENIQYSATRPILCAQG